MDMHDFILGLAKGREIEPELLEALQAMKQGPDYDVLPTGSGRFGYDQTNPIPTTNEQGSTAYLNRLRCPCGVSLSFQRKGNVGPGPDGHVVDQYVLVCGRKKHSYTLFLDIYHAGDSAHAPDGLRLVSEQAPVSAAAERVTELDLQKAIKKIQKELGEACSFDRLIAYIAHARGKPIQFTEDDFPPRSIGYVLALAEHDLVCTPRSLKDEQKLRAQTHLLAHLVLGHVQPYQANAPLPVCTKSGCYASDELAQRN